MKKFSVLNRKTFLLIFSILLLTACGSESETANTNYCDDVTTGVNWNALLNNNCANLSDFNLFADVTDPTQSPNSNGIPYDLSTALFTDYATKYRFVFVPEGKTATYSDNEVMEFPIGSVLVKTFALPDDTSDRTGGETIIETRLLIHRESGWVALPYYWETTADAKFIVTGKSLPVSITHNGDPIDFTYGIPKANQCTSCHAIVPNLQGPTDVRPSIFKPIGPKARFLNHDFSYETETKNQLSYWEEVGILSGAPASKTNISTASTFHDDTDVDAMSSSELDNAARSYLDINCAHCHRSDLTLPIDYAGPAGDSGLRMEFNRIFDDSPATFGVCKSAVASGHNDYPRDVIPGHSELSYLPFRMNTLIGVHKMPELGRSTVHSEGVYLIKKWIDDMIPDNCGLSL